MEAFVTTFNIQGMCARQVHQPLESQHEQLTMIIMIAHYDHKKPLESQHELLTMIIMTAHCDHKKPLESQHEQLAIHSASNCAFASKKKSQHFYCTMTRFHKRVLMWNTTCHISICTENNIVISIHYSCISIELR